MKLPPRRLVRRFDTHRLIPSKYSAGAESVLVRIADDDAHLQDIFDLDNATNERYENHLSYIKDFVPEMGRSFKIIYSLRF